MKTITPYNPELVDAADLDAWAPRREAQELLPRLVRALLTATPGVTGVSVRAGDGIGVPGWDGRATGGTGTAYVPAGLSQWELGTGEDLRGKAQSDYRKRTDDPRGVVPASTALVLVTLRRWGAKDHKDDKDAWVRARQAEGRWREVVAHDADDLEGWLEATPAVHVWLSERMGRRPLEVHTLDRWWQSWSAQTRPALPAELLLAGRHEQARELREALLGTPDVIGVHAGSRDEAIGFLAASLLVPDKQGAHPPGEDMLAMVLVVATPQAWARLAASPSRAILVPAFDGADVAVGVRGGHHVLMPMGSGDDQTRARIVLPRLARDAARDALQVAGWPFDRADRHAAQARRSLRSLRRDPALAVNPVVARPGWARRPAADPFAPLMLIGAWLADSDADREIVAAVTDREYARLERDLAEWAAADDPPFRRSGESWRLVAPVDAWTLLCPVLTGDDLARWHHAALPVLAEHDPALALSPADRPFAALHGAHRRWSADLRRGLAQGAALLGAAGNTPMVGGLTGPDHAAVLVRDLLEQANADATGQVWQSLADVLPLLAEAAPAQFLDGLDAGLAGDPPLLECIFADADGQTGWGVSSPHTGLLWALETLCWPAEHLSRAVDALARLAQVDPGGRLSNRPNDSLRRVLLPWSPQTAAPLARRLAVIDGLLARRPVVGWPLLLALLPRSHDHSHATHGPTFRDWKPAQEDVTLPERLEAIRELVTRALAATQQEPGRWVQLIDRLPDLPGSDLNHCLDALDALPAATLSTADRLALWKAITELVAQHRQFSTADWALSDEPLTRLEAVAARMEPVDAADRHARLFDWHPDLPGTDKFDHASYERAVDQARRVGVRDALASDGAAALIRLAAKSKLPRLVGAIAADVAGDDLGGDLPSELVAAGPGREVATGWVMRMAEAHGWDWIEHAAAAIAGLPDQARSAFYLALPTEPRTWALVDADASAVQDQYWQSVSIFDVPGDNATAFAERLLDRRRPWSAIDLLAVYSHGDDAAKPPARVIERTLRAALDPDTLERPPAGSVDYDVGVLLDRLDAAGTPADTMFELEWAYFPLLEHSRRPRAIHARLAAEPGLFAEAVCAIFRGKHQPTQEETEEVDAATSWRAGNCYSLLRGWRRLPGTADDGTIDPATLRAWVAEARRLLAEQDRAEVGDVCLGELLSGSPLGTDGAWPAEPVRAIVQDLASKDLESGLITGKFNSRGVTTRGAFDGGKQEVTLAVQFRVWAEQVEDRWPRTGRMLRDLADGYARDARRQDALAERHADDG